MPTLKVFVSYSHGNSEHMQRVRGFCDRLRSDGIDAVIDQYFDSPAGGWPRWLESNLREADYVLMICSEHYAKSVEQPDDTGLGRGVRWEGSLIYQFLYSEGINNNRFVPVILEKGDAKFIPPIISGYTYYSIATEDEYLMLYRRLTKQGMTVKPVLGSPSDRSKELGDISVFLCHSSKDKPAVRELYRKLGLNGAKPWLDEEDLLPGQKWEEEIPNAVRQSDAVVVCMSKNAVNKAGYFHKEIAFALDVLERQPENTIYLIPVMLDDCDVPDRLRHLHYVKITDNHGYSQLVRSLLARAHQLQLGIKPDEGA